MSNLLNRKLKYTDTAGLMKGHSHGSQLKNLAVLHETVSGDVVGMNDIINVENYLASLDFGIHGMTDAEGHIAWAYGMGKAIFWQAGGVNERSVGIEQVSRVMLEAPTNKSRARIWAARQPQLRATAQLLAAWHNAAPLVHKLVYSDGRTSGVTSHWDVSQNYKQSLGHTDCWPLHKGGYYPILDVIAMAKVYAKTGLRF